MNKTRSFGVSIATVALAMFAYGASAQEKKPSTPVPAPKAAAKKPPACNSLKDEAPCKVRDDCNWVPAKMDAKDKVKTKAYCRSNPKAAAKKEPAKK